MFSLDSRPSRLALAAQQVMQSSCTDGSGSVRRMVIGQLCAAFVEGVMAWQCGLACLPGLQAGATCWQVALTVVCSIVMRELPQLVGSETL